MLYAIHAYEDYFGGLHGVEKNLVVEAIDERDAEIIAREESLELMSDYNIEEKACWLEDANIAADYEGIEDEDERNQYIEEYLEEYYNSNIAYEIYELKPTNKSLEELDELFYNDPDEFIKNFVKNV